MRSILRSNLKERSITSRYSFSYKMCGFCISEILRQSKVMQTTAAAAFIQRPTTSFRRHRRSSACSWEWPRRRCERLRMQQRPWPRPWSDAARPWQPRKNFGACLWTAWRRWRRRPSPDRRRRRLTRWWPRCCSSAAWTSPSWSGTTPDRL